MAINFNPADLWTSKGTTTQAANAPITFDANKLTEDYRSYLEPAITSRFDRPGGKYLADIHTITVDPTKLDQTTGYYNASDLQNLPQEIYGNLLKQTGLGQYYGNKDAFTNELKNWSTFDTSKLSMPDQLMSPLTSKMVGNNYVRNADLDAWKTGLSDWTTIDPSKLTLPDELKNSLLSKTTMHNNMGYLKTSDLADWQNQAGQWATVDPSSLGLASQYADKLLANAQKAGDKYFLKSGDYTNWLNEIAPDLNSKYASFDADAWKKYSAIPELAGLKSLTEGSYTFNRPDVENIFKQYQFADISNLGDDPLSKALRASAIDMGDNKYALKGSNVDYYKNLANAVSASRIGYYGMNSIMDPFDVSTAKMSSAYPTNSSYPDVGVNIGGKDYIYVPYEMAARIQGNTDPNKDLTYYYDLLANDRIFNQGKVVDLSGNAELMKQISSHIGGTTWPTQITPYMDTPGLGYLLNPSEYWSGRPESILAKYGSNVYDAGTPALAGVNTGQGYHPNERLAGSWLIRNYDPSTGQSLDLLKQLDSLPSGVGNSPYINNLQASKWFAQSPTDKNFYTYQKPDGTWDRTAYDVYQTKSGGGGFLGDIGRALQSLGPVLYLADFIVPGLGTGLASGTAIGSGLSTGNVGQVIGGALGASGALGYNPLGGVSSGLASALPSSIAGAAPYITNGLVGGGLSSLSGGDFWQGALISGLGSYLGDAAKGWGAGLSNATGMSANAGNAVVQGLINGGLTSLSGGDFTKGALAGGLGSYAGSFLGDYMKDLGKQLEWGNKTTNSLASLAQGIGRGVGSGLAYGDLGRGFTNGLTSGAFGALSSLNPQMANALKFTQMVNPILANRRIIKKART